jgi:phosphomevalonate kinase
VQCVETQYEKTQALNGAELFRLCTHFASWDNTAVPASLPPGLTLVLGDVSGGSNTPSMVRLVLEWKKRESQSAEVAWHTLSSLNNNIERLFRTLTYLATSRATTYRQSIAACAAVPASQVCTYQQSARTQRTTTLYATAID